MKIIHISIAALSVLLLSSCSHQNATQILNDPKQKPEILNAICADPQLMTELSEHIAKSDPALQAMVADRELMRVVHTEKHMGSIIRNDSSMANIISVNLISLAAEDSSLRSQLTLAAVQNQVVKSDLQHLLHESPKTGKDKKEKKHKEKKEKSAHKKGKHSKKD